MGEAEDQNMSRFAFLSDIHGNSPALRSVLDDIQREQCAKAFVLGDIINGVDPHGCVHMLHSWSNENGVDLACIKGNAEAYLLTPDRDLLIQQIDAYRANVLKDMQWYQDHLSESDMDWIYSLPDTIRWDSSYLVHDSPMDRRAVQSLTNIPPEYRELNYHGHGIAPDMANSDWQTLFDFMRDDGMVRIFSGHTHSPFYREIDGFHVCNVGSVGLPLDGDPRPSWVMVTVSSLRSWSISIRRVDYDISLTLQLIDQAYDYFKFQISGFQEVYKKMLLNGRHWREYM